MGWNRQDGIQAGKKKTRQNPEIVMYTHKRRQKKPTAVRSLIVHSKHYLASPSSQQCDARSHVIN